MLYKTPFLIFNGNTAKPFSHIANLTNDFRRAA